MNLVGKTVAREDGDTMFFTDGTAFEPVDYENGGAGYMDWAAVQARLHSEQGQREQKRMRDLEALLHPRDRQWLAEQRRIAQERKDREWEATATPEMIGMRNMERWLIADMRRDINRTAFLFEELPPLKKKHRPFKPAPPGTITIPLVRRKVRKVRS